MVIIDDTTLSDSGDSADGDLGKRTTYTVRGKAYPIPAAARSKPKPKVAEGPDLFRTPEEVESCIRHLLPNDTSSEIDVSDDTEDARSSDMDVSMDIISPIERVMPDVDPPLQPYKPPPWRKGTLLYSEADAAWGPDHDNADSTLEDMVKMLGIEDDFEIHTFKTRDDAKLHTVLAQPGDLTAHTEDPKRLVNAEAELFRRRFKHNVAEYNAGEGSPRARRDFTDHIDEYLERWDTFALNDQAEAFKVETKIDILADPLNEGKTRDHLEMRRENTYRSKHRGPIKRKDLVHRPVNDGGEHTVFDWESHPIYPPFISDYRGALNF